MAKSPANRASAFEVLLKPAEFSPSGICVLSGDEAFLKHEVRRTLLKKVLGPDNEDFVAEVLDGASAQLRDVLDAMHERSLFSTARQVVVVIEDADPFIKQYREKLEPIFEHPPADVLLILEVDTWPATTRLAKIVSQKGLTISCQIPSKGRELTEITKQFQDWLIYTAKHEHQKELKRAAADLLLDLLPPVPGILYQEVARLALLADEKTPLDVELVRNNVGGWRTRQTWDMIDAAAEGRANEALLQLDRLWAAGEEAWALLPQMASTLRHFASATRIYEQAERNRRPMSLRAALEASGMHAFKLSAAEAQLKQIGRPRAKQLYRWLLAADLEIKGHNSEKSRARRVLETLIVRISKQAVLPQSAKS